MNPDPPVTKTVVAAGVAIVDGLWIALTMEFAWLVQF
jgi:hypothetical protein